VPVTDDADLAALVAPVVRRQFAIEIGARHAGFRKRMRRRCGSTGSTIPWAGLPGDSIAGWEDARVTARRRFDWVIPELLAIWVVCFGLSLRSCLRTPLSPLVCAASRAFVLGGIRSALPIARGVALNYMGGAERRAGSCSARPARRASRPGSR
jgi:hypothetical protein